MNCLEKAGMLKMDFLGLKTLTVIHDAVVTSAARTARCATRRRGSSTTHGGGAARRPGRLPDAGARRHLRASSSSSRARDDKLRAMKCDRFDDLVATNALIRPGPLDWG
jgi:DNA polymerase III subunit alpha